MYIGMDIFGGWLNLHIGSLAPEGQGRQDQVKALETSLYSWTRFLVKYNVTSQEKNAEVVFTIIYLFNSPIMSLQE